MKEKKLKDEQLENVAGGTEWPDKVECVWCRFTFNTPKYQEIVTCPKCGRKLHVTI